VGLGILRTTLYFDCVGPLQPKSKEGNETWSQFSLAVGFKYLAQ
jgi:hypothetical protein